MDQMNDRDRIVAHGYITTGRCFYCLAPIEALQPGGLNPRHVADQVPYGQCHEARNRKTYSYSEVFGGKPLVDETEFPLKNQDYTVPHYTDEQKRQMIENYIRRLQAPDYRWREQSDGDS